MELQIWMGRAGAGKSRRVLETMQERRQRPQILLVPEHASHEAELDLCRALGPTASRDAEVLSFRNLATRVLAQTGGLADVTLDAGGKLLTMRRALQEVSSRLTVFARPSQRPAFLRQLVALADELYAYQVTPEMLLAQVADMEGAAGDKLRSAALIYGAYDAHLRGEGFDARSRVQKLCDALPESDYLMGKDVYIDGFSYFNRVEEDILETALRQGNCLTVTLLGDESDPQLFQNALRQRNRLKRMAALVHARCEVETLVSKNDGPLGYLERCFFDGEEPWQGGGAAHPAVSGGDSVLRGGICVRLCAAAGPAGLPLAGHRCGGAEHGGIRAAFGGGVPQGRHPRLHQPAQRHLGKAGADHGAVGGGRRYRRI